MIVVLLEMTLFGMLPSHFSIPLSLSCIKLIVNVVEVVVTFFTTPIIIVLMLYLLGFTTSLPLKYHVTLAAGLVANSHVQLACVFVITIVLLGK